MANGSAVLRFRLAGALLLSVVLFAPAKARGEETGPRWVLGVEGAAGLLGPMVAGRVALDADVLIVPRLRLGARLGAERGEQICLFCDSLSVQLGVGDALAAFVWVDKPDWAMEVTGSVGARWGTVRYRDFCLFYCDTVETRRLMLQGGGGLRARWFVGSAVLSLGAEVGGSPLGVGAAVTGLVGWGLGSGG